MESETLILSPLIDRPLGAAEDAALPARADSLLLPTLWRPAPQAAVEAVRRWADGLIGDGRFASVDYGAVIETLSQITGVSSEALADNGWQVSNILDHAGINIAPDAHLERKRLRPGRDRAVLFRGAEGPTPCVRLRPYKKGLLLVKFATLMMGEMSEGELDTVDGMLPAWTPRADYRLHLQALLRWYNSRRRMLDSVTRRTAAEVLSAEERQAMVSQLLQLASMRGAALTAANVYQLDRLLQLLGHAPGDVHSLLHRAAMGITPTAATSTVAMALDMSHLRHIEKETAQAQKLLAEVFEDAAPQADAHVDASADISGFLAALLTRDVWQLDELDALPRPGGMSLDAALEAVNELAAERIGDTVVDLEGDTAYVAVDYKNDLLD